MILIHLTGKLILIPVVFQMVQILGNVKKKKNYMELIEIIRTSLIIFSLISSFVLAVSYLVYKFRDRNRVKPYFKFDDPIPSVVLLKTNEIKEINGPEIKKQHQRFHILNENPPLKGTAKISDALPIHMLRQKPVISYYSFNKNENLHKFNTSRIAE